MEQRYRSAFRGHDFFGYVAIAVHAKCCGARTVVLAIALLVVSLVLFPPDVQSLVLEPSDSNPPAQVVFKHVSAAARSVATLALALITVLVALLALIVDKEGVDRFYDTYPYVSWRRRAAWLGKAANSVFWLFSSRKCIVYVLVFSIVSAIVCFLGHFRPEQASVLQILHRVVEGAMFLAIGLFMVILVRIFNFCLTYKPTSRIAGREGDRTESER